MDYKDELISVQRLYSKNHFDIIKAFNLSRLQEIKRVYPNHEQWVNKVISELNLQTYSRIAFGGFFINRKKREDVLCASAILKKNPFTSYLEIKNLITFNYIDEKYKDNLDLLYKDQIIKHIKGYAEQRGFSKLVTELINRDKKDKELIRLFLENDFIIAGNQINRYKSNDEIVYLVADINLLYGYDPYDNYSMTEWLLNKYLKCSKLNKSLDKGVILVDTESRILEKNYYSFFNGLSYDDPIRSKFNTKSRVIVLEEYLDSNSKLSELNSIKYKDSYSDNSYVFDYSHSTLTSKITQEIPHILFTRTELNSLLGFDNLLNPQYRFPYSNVGGLLLISNPIKFPFDKLDNFINKKINPIYFKLGCIGKYVSIEMPLVFAYYPENNKSTLMIWGIAYQSTTPIVFHLEDLKNELLETEGFSEELSKYSDFLFKALEDNEEGKPLWSKDDFEMHNSYNATQSVICYTLDSEKIISIKDPIKISLDTVLDEVDYFEKLDKEFDFYLSKSEINKIINKLKSITKIKLTEDSQIKINNDSSANKTSPTLNSDINKKSKMQDKKLKKVVILTALQEEFLAVRAHLKDLKPLTIQGSKYETGIFEFESQKIANVTIRECGAKNTVAAQESERAISALKPDIMLFVGIAGSRKPMDFKIGDVIFPEKVYSYMGGKSGKNTFLARPDSGPITHGLMETARHERNKIDWKKLIIGDINIEVNANLGVIASGENLIEHYDSSIGKILTQHYNDTSAVEMEGFGFAKAASRQGPESSHLLIGIVRGISDILEGSDKTSFNNDSDRRPHERKKLASNTAAAFAFWLILIKTKELESKS